MLNGKPHYYYMTQCVKLRPLWEDDACDFMEQKFRPEAELPTNALTMLKEAPHAE